MLNPRASASPVVMTMTSGSLSRTAPFSKSIQVPADACTSSAKVSASSRVSNCWVMVPWRFASEMMVRNMVFPFVAVLLIL